MLSNSSSAQQFDQPLFDATRGADEQRHHLLLTSRAPNAGFSSAPGVVWEAVASGRWTLSERFLQDGRHYLVLTRNCRKVRALCALSPAEETAARGSALGLANKYLAHEYARSQSAISNAIRRARKKLGVRSRLELVQLVHCTSYAALEGDIEQVTLSCPAPETKTLAALTDSERDVLQGILADRSNDQIAKTRGSSPRTIANQVASIFRKLHAASRGELVAKYSSSISSLA